ncbi:putative MAPEG superfamily protein [Litoreibacter meonggei]|uniref:Putative MAPEG superfamily protein n=1 Tax=Litoreibacter meonggei TaxID=1049199 RepID=A0A497X3F0_9RHOB|nr:MAPEG family protein [Litoreibacter meonggei]RLJ59499.1 putative MAPEG superfamily protein [Litoreibacter meonggei]
MTTELTVLILAALLQVAQFALMAVPLNIQLGPEATSGPRDEPLQPSGTPARLKRAFDNHFEGLILFTIAAVVISVSGQSTPVTAACAWLYLSARVLYIPAYAFGLTPWRSVIWAVGFFATITMLVAALL